jgi:hypothetical protein
MKESKSATRDKSFGGRLRRLVGRSQAPCADENTSPHPYEAGGVVSAAATDTAEGSRGPAFVSAVVITGIICIASFILSFVALADLLMRTGQPQVLSYLFPVMIDGTILMATIALVHLSGDGHRKKDRAFFWITLIIGAGVSIAGNGLHAYISHAPGFDPRLAALISAIPPIALLAASHGMTILARRPEAFAVEVAAQPVASPRPADAPQGAESGTMPTAWEAVEEWIVRPEPAHNGGSARASNEELPEPSIAAADGSASESVEARPTFVDDNERREYALRQYANGVKPTVIAEKMGYAPSTVYRWISDAKKNRTLVPQAAVR